jgi:hypothetical protein
MMSPFSMPLRTFLQVIAVIYFFPNFCTGWSIDSSSCAAFSVVSTAMTTALNLAIYAKMRAADTLPRQGTSMVDLLGAPLNMAED